MLRTARSPKMNGERKNAYAHGEREVCEESAKVDAMRFDDSVRAAHKACVLHVQYELCLLRDFRCVYT